MSQTTQEVHYQSESSIELPSPIKERRRAIRKIDWERCKRNINRLKTYQTNYYSKIYSTSAGLAISAFLSYLTIYELTDINITTKNFFLLFTIFSSIFSVIFYLVDRKNISQRHEDIEEIITDMTDIESTFSEESEK